MPKGPALRLAIAIGTMHLPRMHFVVGESAVMPNVEARVFAVSAADKQLSPVPVTQSLNSVRLPDRVRRRLYPVATQTVGRALRHWEPDIINLHFLALGGFAAREAARLGVPLATTVHAAEPFLIDQPRSLRQRKLRYDAELALDRSDLLLPVSEYMARWLVQLGVESARIRTHHSGIDTHYWSSDRPGEERFQARRVVFVGHLTKLKGVVDLISASIAAHPTVPHSLDIVGDGPMRDAVLEATRSHSHISWHGVLNRRDVRRVLSGSSVLCLPTQPVGGIEEAAGTVLLEAQSMGLPAITYAVGGTPEMVSDSWSLVAANDVAGLSAKFADVFASEDAYLKKSQGALNWVRLNRSLEQQAGHLRGLLADLVGGGSGSF
jgi:glycosyltransferase involved in cell wall biosynthesis